MAVSLYFNPNHIITIRSWSRTYLCIQHWLAAAINKVAEIPGWVGITTVKSYNNATLVGYFAFKFVYADDRLHQVLQRFSRKPF
jgi:hypothetical protein